MKAKITEIAEAYWSQRHHLLMERVAEGTRQIENLVRAEDFRREGNRGEHLRKAMEGFGTAAMDMEHLSSILGRGGSSRAGEKERLNRIRSLAADLGKLGRSLEKSPPRCRFLELEQGAPAILEAFDAHMESLAKSFRTLRLGTLEARAGYDPEVHNPFFEDFNWRHLDSAEMALCPPVVVFCEEEPAGPDTLGLILELMTSGKPLKLVLLRRRLDNQVSETGRAAALKGPAFPELLFIALRNVYFLQASPAAPQPMELLLERALASPRAGVLSIYAGQEAQNGAGGAHGALFSRAFPHFVYDPERSPDFVSCLDVSDNPEPEAPWPTEPLEYLDEQGEPARLERPLTFADFAVTEPALETHFTPLPDDAEGQRTAPLAEFLERTPEGRRDVTPFIHAAGPDKRLVRLVPSSSIIAQTADKLHLWRTLQELGGIGNPYVQAAERKVADKLTAEKEEALSALKADLEGGIATRERDAVEGAMKTLALKLTGAVALDAESTPPAELPAPTPAGASLEATATTGEAAAPQPHAQAETQPAAKDIAAEAAGEIPQMPWIEARLCTTCDECTAINKKIFVYNAEKKAVIKDARGGPYRDIVKGAEKCASGAIHPGLPLDPDEKDLEKWIKRAEPYQ